MRGDHESWLHLLRRSSHLLSSCSRSDLYLIHGATNPHSARCLLYCFGIVKFDPTVAAAAYR